MEKTNLLQQNPNTRNHFKNGETDTNTQIVTKIWVQLIEKLEQSKKYEEMRCANHESCPLL